MPHLPKLEVLAMKDDATKIRVKKLSTWWGNPPTQVKQI